jgi:hypothetical protein
MGRVKAAVLEGDQDEFVGQLPGRQTGFRNRFHVIGEIR